MSNEPEMELSGTFASYRLPDGSLILTARYKDAHGNEGEYKKKISKLMMKMLPPGLLEKMGKSDD